MALVVRQRTRRFSSQEQDHWEVGNHVRIYRAAGGRAARLHEDDGELTEGGEGATPRDYDVRYYVRLLRETFAARLVRAFTGEDFQTLTADPEQPSLFALPIASIHPVLVPLLDPPQLEPEAPSA